MKAVLEGTVIEGNHCFPATALRQVGR